MICCAKAQRVHHSHRTRTHRQDVANNPADPRGRPLIWLHIRRMIVRLNLEGDSPAVTDVDNASILTNTDEQGVRLWLLVTELPQVHLARLVGAVLTPHDRVHGQLC